MILPDLTGFTGSAQLYRTIVPGVRTTEGVNAVAAAGAGWLVDKIATCGAMLPDLARESFQVWKLAANGGAARLSCEDGNDNELYSERLSYTDFPPPGITLWMVKRVIMLPSEY